MPERLFDTLEPPAGGLVRLRGRIARDTRRRARRRRVRSVAAATLLVAMVSWAAIGPRGQQPPLPAEFDLVRMSLGLLAVPAEALTIPESRRSETAVRRVPLPTDQVVFYLVGSIQE